MAKVQPAQEQFIDQQFPLQGVDLSNEYVGQRPQTTEVGTNCRAFEPLTHRGRGGSRAGLVRYLDTPIIAGALIQHLNIIVDPQAEALGISFDDTGGDDEAFEDPSDGGRNLIGDGSIGDIYVGGSGFHTNKNKSPKHPKLRIVANNRTKTFGDTLVFANTEYTKTGLLSGDSIASLFLSSTGADAGAALGTYPILIGTVNLNLTHIDPSTGLPLTYRIKKIPGTLTVQGASTVAFVQANNEQYTYGIEPPPNSLAFNSDVSAGNLIVVAFSSNFVPGATPAIADSQGNAYTLAGTGVGGTDIDSNVDVQRIFLWYTLAGSSGPNTVTINYTVGPTAGRDIEISLAEYSGLSGVVDAVVPGNNSYHAANPALAMTTQTIPVNFPNDLVIAVFNDQNGNAATPDAGWTQRTANSTRGIIIDNLDVSASVAATMTVAPPGATYGYVEIGISFLKT